MRQLALGSAFLALALVSAGCSGGKSSAGKEDPDIGPDVNAADTPEALLQASVQLLNALADVLAEIKDKDSARKAEPKLEVLNRKAKILAAKIEELHFDPEQQQRLTQKYKNDSEKAGRRIENERRRINADPELSKLVKEIDRRSLLK
ncbi:MAG: hypothetical protein HYS12_03145 [Planctomycetes bacterium]|nr:hypothetical protein [Planctomycetota bacterium]